MRNDIIPKWIQKAENDFKIGRDELNTKNPAMDMICFHMQQCAEKYLKAYLPFHKKYFRKTHDILELIELCKEVDNDFRQLIKKDAEKLTRYGVDIRYPDDFYIPTIEEAKKCIKIAKEVKIFVLSKLKGDGFNTQRIKILIGKQNSKK